MTFPAMVTPYVGVWIEIPAKPKVHRGELVTPYVGVWIEIPDTRI